MITELVGRRPETDMLFMTLLIKFGSKIDFKIKLMSAQSSMIMQSTMN